jgi:LuxR family maltose regulon positive regulatory protein
VYYRVEYTTYARLLLAEGRPQDARTVLDALDRVLQEYGLAHAIPAGFYSTPTIVLILQALALQALGRGREALARLDGAVERAAPEGCRRVFLNEGPAVAEMLPGVRHVAPDFVDRLLDDFRAEGERRRPGRSLVEPLTPRETEVLRLIAAGLKNQEIADRLVISVATVKRHISNVYGKLGVRERADAIARAVESGLAGDAQ